MSLEVQVSTRATRELRNLPSDVRARIVLKLEAAAEAPEGHAIPLTGRDAWKLRVGDYRVIVEILRDEGLLRVLKVGHRRHVYRG